MSYVDAGYAIALSVLAAYAASLALRRRRLERRPAAQMPSVVESGAVSVPEPPALDRPR